MKAEHFWNGSYSDSQWDDFVAELKKGHKLLIGTTGSSCGGSSLFAGCMHALLLDHYDESKDAVYLFDPNMSSYKVSTSGAEAFSSDVRDGAYISRTVMNDYLRPDSAYALIYGDDSCYNICEPKGGNETTPIYPLDEDSADIACAQGTKDLGVYENAHYFGKEIKVRLCALPNLPSSGSESVSSSKYYIDGAEGKAVVNSRVSGAFYALVERAKSEGIDLTASSSFRAYAHQADLWVENGCSASGCSGTTTAPAGSSNHEGGYAIDFNGTCSSGIGPAACDASGNVVSLWLRDNIGDFGFVRTVSTEAWHVDAPAEPLNGED